MNDVMTVNEVKETVHKIIKGYFSDIDAKWAQVGGTMSEPPVAVLMAGAVNRSLFPSTEVIDGEVIHHFPSDMMLEINYYSDSSGEENTATNDLEEFLNYLNSPYIIQKYSEMRCA